MAGVEAPQKRIVVVARVGLVRLALSEHFGAATGQHGIKSGNSLLGRTLYTVGQNDLMQGTHQIISAVLPLESVQRQRFLATTMYAHLCA